MLKNILYGKSKNPGIVAIKLLVLGRRYRGCGRIDHRRVYAKHKNSYYPEGQTVESSAKQKYVSNEGTATALENLKSESFLKDTLKFSGDVWVFGTD